MPRTYVSANGRVQRKPFTHHMNYQRANYRREAMLYGYGTLPLTRDRFRALEAYEDAVLYLGEPVSEEEPERIRECEDCGDLMPEGMHGLCWTCVWWEVEEIRYHDEPCELPSWWRTPESGRLEALAHTVMAATRGYSEEARAHALKVCGLA